MNGKRILGNSSNSFESKCALAVALLNAKINDGDDDMVNYTGYYKNDAFIVETITSSGFSRPFQEIVSFFFSFFDFQLHYA